MTRRSGALAAILVIVVLLGGCSVYSGTTAQKVQEWAKRTRFDANNNQIVSDVVLVRKTAAGDDGPQFLTDCAGTPSDLGKAYVKLPTPDLSLTNELDAAYTLIGKATQACSATNNVHSAVAKTALAEIDAGMIDLQKCQRQMASLGFKWVNKQL